MQEIAYQTFYKPSYDAVHSQGINIQMPSEISDSYDQQSKSYHKYQNSDGDKSSVSSSESPDRNNFDYLFNPGKINIKNYLNQQNDQNQVSSDYYQSNQKDKVQQSPAILSDSKYSTKEQALTQNDSFLDRVNQHLNELKSIKQSQLLQNFTNQSTLKGSMEDFGVSLSKTQIKHCLLENQSTVDKISITNLFSFPEKIRLLNSPFQFKLLNSKNKFMKRDFVEIQLDSFETIQIAFEIQKKQGEIGNIYETLILQILDFQGQKITVKHLKFEINFLKPKLQMAFLGKMQAKRVHEHKIGLIQLYPSQLNEYFLNFTFSEDQFAAFSSMRSRANIPKIQVQICIKGGHYLISPTSAIFYLNEPVKLILRQNKNTNYKAFAEQEKRSVIVLKLLHSSLNYVIGVKCITKQNLIERLNGNYTDKINKFTF